MAVVADDNSPKAHLSFDYVERYFCKHETNEAMRAGLIAVDDFYANVDEVRALALSLDFSETGNFPGRRTISFADPTLQRTLEAILHARIVNWQLCQNGAFQYTTSHDRTWIHADHLTTWAGVVYLTPDAPASSGTSFFTHIETGFSSAPDDLTLLDICNADSQDYTKWIRTDFVSNLYNRLVLFPGQRFHASNDYFGQSLTDGRLFQTFFFNVE